jgi:xanthine dehydrogenase accessory factor
VLTHDPKFDVPVLKAALETPAGYIGAMGSRRTHNNRTARLKEEGVSEDELVRVSSPIGLDIGARTPEETAVAIAGEIIALRTGHSGGRLSEHSGPIHAPEPDTTPSPHVRDTAAAAQKPSR